MFFFLFGFLVSEVERFFFPFHFLVSVQYVVRDLLYAVVLQKEKRKRKRKTFFFSSSIFRFMKLSGTDTDSDRFSSVGFFLPNFRRVHRVSSDSVPANYFDFSLNCVEFKCDPSSFLPFCGVFLFAGVTLSISQWID